jgi:hypothetical protein
MIVPARARLPLGTADPVLLPSAHLFAKACQWQADALFMEVEAGFIVAYRAASRIYQHGLSLKTSPVLRPLLQHKMRQQRDTHR